MQLWRSNWRLAGTIAAAATLLSSCLLTSSFDGLTGGPTLPDAGDDGASRCPGKVGPSPVAIPELGFCIDSTEVTNAEYAQFLASMPDVASLPSVCAWKTTFVPKLLGDDDLPVVGVDWCDAYAFCAWNDKRLCGKIGGGPLAPAEETVPDKSEWMAACSAHGTRAYPYAPINYAPKACNGADQGVDMLVKAGSLSSCEGGYPGILDMSGNVGEWEGACDEADPDPKLHSCGARGGDYGESPADLTCNYVETHARADRADYIGFRCCGG